ncbi:MAG: hypothetical protein KGJ23_08070 [Euryarchaeota archaeon]|nr:hypothetical protein [Euryarchaeota archaeon]MDE1836557.1 hypothetical protein [Euryarchaeota archaeon]MDE1879248.1 hypothetical protein [Euryarchaeota archaeon]MDE2044527.1 hypothetical protein [Thermoplasmata archaeon]
MTATQTPAVPYPNAAPGGIPANNEVPNALPTVAALKAGSVWVGGGILSALPENLRREVMQAVRRNRMRGHGTEQRGERQRRPMESITIGDLLFEQVCSDPDPRKRAVILERLTNARDAARALAVGARAPTPPGSPAPVAPSPTSPQERRPFNVKGVATGISRSLMYYLHEEAKGDDQRWAATEILDQARLGFWGVRPAVMRLLAESEVSRVPLAGAVEVSSEMDRAFWPHHLDLKL